MPPSSPSTADPLYIPDLAEPMDHFLARLARSEAATQQYENNSRSAARATPATALQQSRGSPTQNADGFSPAAVQAELVTGIIYNLLAARDDAFDILQAVAERLEPAVQFAVPGPVEGQQNATVAPTATVPDQIAAAFAYWRRYAAAHCRLLVLARSIQSRRSSSEPKVIKATTWAERDAALRGDAVSIPSASSSADEPASTGLPFTTAADLPPDLLASKDHAVIRNIITGRLDRTLNRWGRRTLYTADNWAEWAAWSIPGRTHRDRIDSGRDFLDPYAILIAPDLRSADAELAADAWNAYRRHLLILIRQALTVGFPWAELLTRLASTLSDQRSGYPRLANYITCALDDTSLIRYPLLHADVLFYKLDCSYAVGSSKYSSDSVTVDWERATSRLPGEDPISLAIRVTNAFLTKHDSPTLTDVTVWEHPSFTNEINRRYSECLCNDIADPERGADIALHFNTEWHKTRALLESDPSALPSLQLSCEYIAKTVLVAYESVYHRSAPPNGPAPPPQPLLTQRSQPTGRGARARRDELRAGFSGAGLPSLACNPDLLPEQR